MRLHTLTHSASGRKASALALCLLLSSFLISCSDDDPVAPPVDGSTPLAAKAGANQQVEIGQTVTLDGSASTGPTGFTYSWAYEGDIPESEINFQSKTSATPTFVPPANGFYTFTLTISFGDSSDSDDTAILAGGSLEIGGTLTSDLQLRNIQPNSSLPDYTVISDLVVPNGIKLSIVEDDVVVAFNSGTGIYVQQGGTFTNTDSAQSFDFASELSGTDGWKGILVENGTINLEKTVIVNAGTTAFANQTEAAALTLSGTRTNLVSFSDNEFVNSSSYDILVTDRFPEVSRAVTGNKLSFRVPIKAPITFVGFWFSETPNVNPENYDYIHLMPSGANTRDVITNPNGFNLLRPDRGRYYIDGDFWAGSVISVGDGCTIYMKENSGIRADNGMLGFGRESRWITFQGLDGKAWKGITQSPSGGSGRVSFQYTRILNAGYGIISIGGFTAQEEAAVYSARTTGTSLESCEIAGSNGFGYYNDQTGLVSDAIRTTLFKDCNKGGIRINLASVNQCIRRDHGNTFELAEGVPPVLVTEADLSPGGRLYGLGTGNFYLMDTDWSIADDFKIEEGVHLKFRSGRSFRRESSPFLSIFEINGTQSNPVIFEGENNTPGSWGGMYLGGYFMVNYLVVRNGGGFLLNGASELANVVSKAQQSGILPSYFINSEVSNSAGWGIVVEQFSYDFQYDDPAKNNTFLNNASGNVIVKP